MSFALMALACMALALRFLAFDQFITMVAGLWSRDGEISASNGRALGLLLIEIASWCAVLGIAALAMAHREWRARLRSWLFTDVLETAPGSVPNPLRILVLSTGCGAVIIALWALDLRTRANFGWLYRK